ncbi:MAG TPA: hypothetical protein VIG62_00025 [Blastocatellia bacterium]
MRPALAYRETLFILVLLAGSMVPGCKFSAEASREIGRDGGKVEVVDAGSPCYGAKVFIPPGGVSAKTPVSITAKADPAYPPDVTPVAVGPTETRLNTPAEVEIPYSDQLVKNSGIKDEQELAVFAQDEKTGRFHALKKTGHDANKNLIRAETDRLTVFAVMSLQMFSAYFQRAGLLDPAEEMALTLSEDLGHSKDVADKAPGQFLVSNSLVERKTRIGKGSLRQLSNPGAHNLILVHGAMSGAEAFALEGGLVNKEGLLEGLKQDYDNVVAFQYPWGKRIDETGALLARELIKYNVQNADIIAHGTGGLIARWAIEQEEGVKNRINNLVTISTPHRGVGMGKIWEDWAERLKVTIPPIGLLPGLRQTVLMDAEFGQPFFQSLNNTKQGPGKTRYFLIAGDDGTRGDGLIMTSSAIPVAVSNTGEGGQFVFSMAGKVEFKLFSGPDYTHASLIKRSARNGVLDQARQWLKMSDDPQTSLDMCNGWDSWLGTENGSVRCQGVVVKSGPRALEVERGDLTFKTLSQPLTGLVEFTAWALPARGGKSSFAIGLGNSRGSSPDKGQLTSTGNRLGITVALNNAGRWTYTKGRDTAAAGAYSMQWTRVRLLINTRRNAYSMWIDGRLIARGLKAATDLSGGIDSIGLLSDRASAGQSSYIEAITLRQPSGSGRRPVVSGQ